MDRPNQVNVQTMYLQRPSPEYEQAFDLAAARLNSASGPALVVVSSPANGVEFLKRCAKPLDFAIMPGFDARGFVTDAAAWAWGPVRAVSLLEIDEQYTAMCWAEPEGPSAQAVALQLRAKSAACATLDVVASSALRRLLPIWRQGRTPALQPISPRQAARCLIRAGWRAENTAAFHGPRSVVWSRLAQLAAVFNRPDWEDTCQFAMRSAYRETGWARVFAPLTLIRARHT